MSIEPIERISAILPVQSTYTYRTTALQGAQAVEHSTTIEQENQSGRTVSTSTTVLTIYDSFGNLQTLGDEQPSTIKGLLA